MIIDSILYSGEADILTFRLKLLWDLIDRFIIIEGTHTFSGRHKQLQFPLQDFEWAKEKIKYYPFTPKLDGLNLDSKPDKYDPNHDCWQIEYQQRNAILDATENYFASDTLIISDVDEIPSREAIKLSYLHKDEPAVCTQAFFYYNCKRLRLEQWNGSIITTVGHARAQTPQKLRDCRNIMKRISPGGYHLSYFGDVKAKIESFSHQELNVPQFKNEQHIERCKKTGADLFNRGTQSAAIDKSFFPQYFLDNAPKGWFE